MLVSLLRDMLAQVLVVVVDEAPVGGVVQAALHVLYLVVLSETDPDTFLAGY